MNLLMSYGGSMLTPTIPGTGSRGFKILHFTAYFVKLAEIVFVNGSNSRYINISIYIYTHSVYLYAPRAALEQNHVFFWFDLVLRVVPPKVKSQRRKHSSTTWDLGIKKPLKLSLED